MSDNASVCRSAPRPTAEPIANPWLGKRALVTGAAGFLGFASLPQTDRSWTRCRRCDNLSTGRAENVADLRESAAFDLMLHDVVVTLDVDGQVDYVFHLATYGPGMRCDDGRAVPEFTARALRGAPLLVTGTGLQTRSLCFVSDLVEGLLAMAAARGAVGPVNLGNPHEVTVLDLALTIRELCESESEVRLVPGRQDDPRRRCPDVALARELLSWSARVELRDGLAATVEAFRRSVPLTPSRGSTVGAR